MSLSGSRTDDPSTETGSDEAHGDSTGRASEPASTPGPEPEREPELEPGATPGCDRDPNTLDVIPDPTVNVVFPSADVVVNATQLTVRGKATAFCGTTITAMSAEVDDTEIAVPISPGADVGWSIELPLATDSATPITIVATTSTGQEGRDRVSVRQEGSEIDPEAPRGMAFDAGLNVIHVVDNVLASVLKVDLETGTRSVFSGPGVGMGPAFGNVQGDIVVDLANDRLLLMDKTPGALVAVDRATGDRSVLSDNSDPGPQIRSPEGVAMDQTRTGIYYVDTLADAVVRVDLTTGERFVVSDGNVPADPQPVAIRYPRALALDVDNGRLLVTDSQLDGLVSVDLADGSRAEITQSTTDLDLSLPRGVLLDGERALVTDLGVDAIVAIDLRPGSTFGDRTIVSGDHVGSGPRFVSPRDVVIDAANERMIVVDSRYRMPLMVSMSVDNAGDRVPLWSRAELLVGEGARFTDPSGLALNATDTLLYVSDADTGRVLAIDLSTQERTVIADPFAASASVVWPLGLAYDPVRERLVVPDNVNKSVVSFALADGAMTVISDSDSPDDASTTFVTPGGSIGIESGSLLIADRTRQAVFRVQESNGERTYLAQDTDLLGDVRSLVLDAANNRALVSAGREGLQFRFEGILAIDLADGTPTVLATTNRDASPVGTGAELTAPVAITLDSPNAALLVFDSELDAIISLDLVTLERTVLVDAATGNGDYLTDEFSSTNVMALGERERLLYVANAKSGEVVEVDLITGDQAVIAR